MLQLSELLSVEIYTDWIRLVAEFTAKSLHSWQVCSLSFTDLHFTLCPTIIIGAYWHTILYSSMYHMYSLLSDIWVLMYTLFLLSQSAYSLILTSNFSYQLASGPATVCIICWGFGQDLWLLCLTWKGIHQVCLMKLSLKSQKILSALDSVLFR